MIGVVTVTFNSEEVLPDFLQSLRSQPQPYRLYAVDNASTDGSLEVLQRADEPSLVLLEQTRNLGIAVGNNVGIRRALADGCEWILLVNNDTVFDEDLLGRMIESADSSGAGIVVPSIRYFDEPDEVWFESATFDRWRGAVPVAQPPRRPADVVEIECASTCCALVRPSVFDDIDLMDERFFVYWDDTDFFYRADQAGIRIVLDARITLLHKVSSLTGGGESVFSQTERIKNRVIFIRKHSRGLRRWIGLVLTVANAGGLVIAGPNRRARAGALVAALWQGSNVRAD